MLKKSTVAADVRRTLLLALPLMGAQILQVGNGLVDALISGKIGRDELAAGGIGAGLWFFASLTCIGLTAGLSPVLSKMIGQRRQAFVGQVFRQGLYLGVTTGVVAMIGLRVASYLLTYTAIEPILIPLIQEYLHTASFSLIPFGVLMACRNVLEATAVTRPVLLVTSIGLAVNILGDLAFGLGYFGFPKLGLGGIGLSTAIVTICMMLVILWVLTRAKMKRYELFGHWRRPDIAIIGQILRLSLPIYVGTMFEAGLFMATAIQMGMLGSVQAGAHNVAINLAAVCYMLPLGLSFVLTARIGRSAGRENPPHSIVLRIYSGFIVAIIMAGGTAILLVMLRQWLPALFTDDIEVRALAAKLLLLAALFQLSDSAQVILLGMLRGLHDTLVPMLINAFSYWAIAFGLGYYLAHEAGWGAYGLWTGLITGLTLASLLLGVRLHRVYGLYIANSVQQAPLKDATTGVT